MVAKMRPTARSDSVISSGSGRDPRQQSAIYGLREVEDAVVAFSKKGTRRGFVRLLGVTAVCLLFRLTDMQTSAFADAGCQVEYPPKSLGDCPNKRHHPGHTPTSNGCGPEGGHLPIPQGFGDANFAPGCNAHDICYGTCNNVKATCDADFGNALRSVCVATYPRGVRRSACISVANAYQGAVSSQGQSAFNTAQLEDCECCRPPATSVYCACNHKCYSDVGICLSECKATLGCFTDICSPATSGQCLS